MFKEMIAIKNDETLRVGLSSFKTFTKKIEDARTSVPSISSKDIKLSDLMRRTNLY